MEDDDLPPGLKPDDFHTILDPVIIADYEIAEYRQLKNPHEYLDKLIRDTIFSQCKRELEHQKHEIFKSFKKKSKAEKEYLRHFMVLYEDKMKA